MNRKWLLYFVAGLAIALGIRAGDQLALAERIQADATIAPEALSLAQLLDRPPNSNPHVQVSGYVFGSHYAYEAINSTWTAVWVPIFTPDGRAALVKTRYIGSEREMEQFRKTPKITGNVTSHIAGLGASELRLLQNAYPNLNIKSLPVIEDRAVHADPQRIPFAILALATAVIVPLLCAAVWRVVNRAPAEQSPTETPADVPEEGATMGKLLAVFRERDAGRMYIAASLLLLVLGAGACPLLITNDSLDNRWKSYGMFGIGAIALIAAVPLGAIKLRNRLWVFESGLVQKTGRTVDAVTWDRVRGFTNRFTYQTQTGWEAVGSTPILQVFGNGNINLLVEPDHPFELGQLVQNLVYESLYSRMKTRLEQGHEISFGDVAVSAAGLRREVENEEPLPWFQIASVGWERHPTNGSLYLVIKRPTSPYPWFSVLATSQDNVGLLFRLANEYLGVFDEQLPPSSDPDAENFPP